MIIIKDIISFGAFFKHTHIVKGAARHRVKKKIKWISFHVEAPNAIIFKDIIAFGAFSFFKNMVVKGLNSKENNLKNHLKEFVMYILTL